MTAEREAELRERVRSGDPGARQELIDAAIPYARRLIANVYGGLPLFDDLFGVAFLVIVEQARSWDPDDRRPFLRTLGYRIRGRVYDYLAANAGAVVLPREFRVELRRIEKVRHRLEGQLGRAVTHGELADELGISLEELGRRLCFLAGAPPLEPCMDESEDAFVPLDDHGTPEDATIASNLLTATMAAARKLPARDRGVLFMAFGLDRAAPATNEEIASAAGVTPPMATRWRRGALDALHARMMVRPSVQRWIDQNARPY